MQSEWQLEILLLLSHAGMDFYVVLDRPGYRVSRRRRAVARVGVQHRVNKDDAIKWFQTKFEGAQCSYLSRFILDVSLLSPAYCYTEGRFVCHAWRSLT